MPCRSLRLVGIAFLACLLLAACAVPGTEPVPEVSPAATATAAVTTAVAGRSNAPWALGLILSGDLSGTLNSTAPSQGALSNECTGKNSLGGRVWSSTFVLAGAGDPKALVVLSPDYQGAGTYSAGVSIQVHNADHSAVWQNRGGDAVAWTVGNDEESGRVAAQLTNLSDVTKKLTLSGTWTCRTT